MNRPPPRPLLVTRRALGLGDLLTAVPALRGLAGAFPCHHRVLAAPRSLAPLVGLTGAVDAVVDTAPLAPLDGALAGPDVAVNLHGRGPRSHRVLLEAAPRRLVAFRHPAVRATGGSPRWREDEHEVTRWCRLLSDNGIPADPRRLDLEVTAGADGDPGPGTTVVHPGAASPARRWPARRWATVARAESHAGRRVVVTGDRSEESLARVVAAGAGLPPTAVWAGRTDLLELARLVATAARVVCGDTGVAHLATAVRTPSVVLFGPTSPARWGPPTDRPWHRALWRGGTGDPHGATADPGLLRIRVDDVLAALADLDRIAPSGGGSAAGSRQPPSSVSAGVTASDPRSSVSRSTTAASTPPWKDG